MITGFAQVFDHELITMHRFLITRWQSTGTIPVDVGGQGSEVRGEGGEALAPQAGEMT